MQVGRAGQMRVDGVIEHLRGIAAGGHRFVGMAAVARSEGANDGEIVCRSCKLREKQSLWLGFSVLLMTPSLIALDLVSAAADALQAAGTDGGASICTTRSIAPMSMPSSSDEVATSARSGPDLSRSSISMRCSRAIDP